MRKLSRMILVIISVVGLILSLSLGGCTRHPNEKQLQALEEQRKATLGAEEQLAKCQQQKADFDRELAEKKQKLEDVKSEKATVTNRLSGM